MRSVDVGKDQSYVLAVLTAAQLAHAMFPIGDSTKAQVRDEAARRGLAVARKPDSHDICFIADGDTRGFLSRQLGERSGPIVDATTGTVVGRHGGSFGFTVGQRRGLHLDRAAADGAPRYVLSLEPATNTVLVGPREQLEVTRIIARAPGVDVRGQPERAAGLPGAAARTWHGVRRHGDRVWRSARRGLWIAPSGASPPGRRWSCMTPRWSSARPRSRPWPGPPHQLWRADGVCNPWPPGAATGIGSWPGTDVDEAVRTVLGELPDLPVPPGIARAGCWRGADRSDGRAACRYAGRGSAVRVASDGAPRPRPAPGA